MSCLNGAGAANIAFHLPRDATSSNDHCATGTIATSLHFAVRQIAAIVVGAKDMFLQKHTGMKAPLIPVNCGERRIKNLSKDWELDQGTYKV